MEELRKVEVISHDKYRCLTSDYCQYITGCIVNEKNGIIQYEGEKIDYSEQENNS